VPAIISREMFDAGQSQLKQNALMSDRNSKHTYLLKGLIHCGEEMGSMHGIPCHGKRYYRCYFKSKLNSPVPCKASIVKADTVESIVWESVSQFLTDPNLIKDQFEKWIKKKEKESSTLQTSDFQSKNIEQKLLSLKTEENSLLKAFTSEAISLDQLKEQNSRILKERKELTGTQLKVRSIQDKAIISIPKTIDFYRYAEEYKVFLNKAEPIRQQTILRKAKLNVTILNRILNIKGVLPDSSFGCIESTTSGGYRRNVTLPPIEFEIVRRIPKLISNFRGVYYQ